MGVREPPGQRQGRLDAPQRLVRIAQHPEGHRLKGTAGHPGILAVAHGVGAVLLRVIEGQASLRGVGLGQFALPPRGIPQHPVPLHQEQGVLPLLGEPEELLPQLPRPL